MNIVILVSLLFIWTNFLPSFLYYFFIYLSILDSFLFAYFSVNSNLSVFFFWWGLLFCFVFFICVYVSMYVCACVCVLFVLWRQCDCCYCLLQWGIHKKKTMRIFLCEVFVKRRVQGWRDSFSLSWVSFLRKI